MELPIILCKTPRTHVLLINSVLQFKKYDVHVSTPIIKVDFPHHPLLLVTCTFKNLFAVHSNYQYWSREQGCPTSYIT